MTDKWLNVKTVAARLNVSEKTVYNWLKAGQLAGRKVGKSWVITETSLERLLDAAPPAPGARARRPDAQSLEEIADRFAAIIAGAARNDIIGILDPRRASATAGDRMDAALDAAVGDVRIMGIGLPAYFNDQGRHIFTLRRMQAEDRDARVRALLAHPAGEFAKRRVNLEARIRGANGAPLALSPFYASSVRSMHLITAMRNAAPRDSRFHLDAKFVHYWPSAHVLLTDKVCFVESYHFGVADAAAEGHSEGNVPVLMAAAGSGLYNAFRAHFEYFWEGKDPQIKTSSLEQTVQDIQPNAPSATD